MRRIAFALIVWLVCTALSVAGSRAGSLGLWAGCGPADTLHVQWTFTEDPSLPTGHPEWTGYDLLRRAPRSCTPFVRVNAAPFPRLPGTTQTIDYREPAPAPDSVFEYQVVLVDANRQPVALESWLCDPCVRQTWASCPDASAPLTQGTLTDWGWALLVEPCAEGCYHSFYFDRPDQVAALRPYAGTATAFRFYGLPACGTVEGCAMQLDRWESAPCGAITPSLRSGWGKLRAIYR